MTACGKTDDLADKKNDSSKTILKAYVNILKENTSYSQSYADFSDYATFRCIHDYVQPSSSSAEIGKANEIKINFSR